MADRSLREALTEARTAINEATSFVATEMPDAVGTLQELSRVRELVDATLASSEPAGLVVTDQAAESAARVLHEAAIARGVPHRRHWQHLSVRQKDRYINDARAALEAAVPFLQGSANQHQDLAIEPASGAARIAAERRRQVKAEGYSAEHDAAYHSGPMEGALARAATAYALASYSSIHARDFWPWREGFKPSTDQSKPVGPPFAPETEGRIRDLEKAGALIAAEIDRLRDLGEGDS